MRNLGHSFCPFRREKKIYRNSLSIHRTLPPFHALLVEFAHIPTVHFWASAVSLYVPSDCLIGVWTSSYVWSKPPADQAV